MNIVQFFRRAKQLRELGILGMNERNNSFIARYNPRMHFPLVDNKLLTKELAIEFGLSTPTLLGVIDNQHDVKKVAQLVDSAEGFCVKPAKGSGGKGILIVERTQAGKYLRPNGQELDRAGLKRHVSNILAGLFSLGGATDIAMFESLLKPSSIFEQYSHQGVPDIRVIVFRGIPVMAMIRLACSASQGKANLHQGAIGVGLDLKTGSALHAVQMDRQVLTHPDTGVALSDLQIPHWQALLELSCACQDISGLGYLGVDLVIDQVLGPTLLELNARPGLSIQIANGAGLLPRLRMIERLKKPSRLSVAERIEYAQTHF
jgi:alpha-L-glutamate ligase-like protein